MLLRIFRFFEIYPRWLPAGMRRVRIGSHIYPDSPTTQAKLWKRVAGMSFLFILHYGGLSGGLKA